MLDVAKGDEEAALHAEAAGLFDIEKFAFEEIAGVRLQTTGFLRLLLRGLGLPGIGGLRADGSGTGDKQHEDQPSTNGNH